MYVCGRSALSTRASLCWASEGARWVPVRVCGAGTAPGGLRLFAFTETALLRNWRNITQNQAIRPCVACLRCCVRVPVQVRASQQGGRERALSLQHQKQTGNSKPSREAERREKTPPEPRVTCTRTQARTPRPGFPPVMMPQKRHMLPLLSGLTRGILAFAVHLAALAGPEAGLSVWVFLWAVKTRKSALDSQRAPAPGRLNHRPPAGVRCTSSFGVTRLRAPPLAPSARCLGGRGLFWI